MKKVLLKPLFRRFSLLGFLFLFSNGVYSAQFCANQYYIDATLPNGSKWDMCWEHREREGVVYHHVFYTPKDGSRQQVLYNAAVAQIHVPYDDNGARFHDISDYGIGGRYLLNLTSAECPNGTLKKISGKNAICQQIESRHIAHHANSDKLHGDALSLFSISKIGAYHYLPQWRFFDDGTIQPSIGATGSLQRFTNTRHQHGWPINSSRTGVAHLHNFFWRLDFDLGSAGTDDYVEELNFPLIAGKRERAVTRFDVEIAREVDPINLRSWRIVDGNTENDNGHKKSYEIILSESGHKDKGPSSEPYTHNDFFVTKSDQCEVFASHNPTRNNCKRNLAQFVNEENISGKDIIVWVGLTFYHMPRVEDSPHMDAHWSHFNIVPRDLHAKNPLGSTVTPINTAPSITTPGNQIDKVGDNISLTINASDVDLDTLSYTASGLPSGLSINNLTGGITGTINPVGIGIHNVTVTVNDGQLNSTVSFEWKVTTGVVENGIVIDGNDADWDQITPYTDTPNENLSPVDIETLSVTADENKVYLAYRDRQVINPDISWAWQVLIDSDYKSDTGLLYSDMGGDHILIGKELFKYAGDGESWIWTSLGDVEGAVNGKFAELAIDRSIIGSSNQLKMTFYGANSYAGGVTNDFLYINIPDVTGEGNVEGSIIIDGRAGDWASVQAISDAEEGDTSPVDFQTVWFKQDSQAAYFAYNNRINIDVEKFWAWIILIDSDKNIDTGLNFYGQSGGDFLLLGNSLYKYAGTGEDWKWTLIRKVSSSINGKFAELAVDKRDINNSNDFNLIYYGSNTYAGGVTDDSIQVIP